MLDPVNQDRKAEEVREVNAQMKDTRAADCADEYLKYSITPDDLDDYCQNLTKKNLSILHGKLVNCALHGTNIDLQALGDAFYQAIWEQVKEEELDRD